MLRRDLALLVDRLLDESNEGEDLSIDSIAERLVPFRPSQAEIDEVLVRLETHGRTVAATPPRHDPKERIRRVLDASRALKAELGRPPREAEIAARSDLTLFEVRATRLLLRVMSGG